MKEIYSVLVVIRATPEVVAEVKRRFEYIGFTNCGTRTAEEHRANLAGESQEPPENHEVVSGWVNDYDMHLLPEILNIIADVQRGCSS